jgi:hypothetical protein
METTPLDGYKKISVTVLTTLLTVILFFVKDPVHASTLEQFWSGVLIPMVPVIVGMVYTVVQGGVDKEKVKSTGAAAASSTAAGDESPKAESAPVVQPAVAQITVQAAEAETYTPVDLDKYVAAAEEGIRKDGQQVNPLTRAFYFWPAITRFDLRPIPRQLRISEGKRIVDKGIELFVDAFKFYTRLEKPPTPAQAASIHSYMLELRKGYEKANNMTCSDKTFEELRNMLTYFNDLYTAADGLAKLDGKTIDWSIYGTGFFGPTQVGWDFAKLL